MPCVVYGWLHVVAPTYEPEEEWLEYEEPDLVEETGDGVGAGPALPSPHNT